MPYHHQPYSLINEHVGNNLEKPSPHHLHQDTRVYRHIPQELDEVEGSFFLSSCSDQLLWRGLDLLHQLERRTLDDTTSDRQLCAHASKEHIHITSRLATFVNAPNDLLAQFPNTHKQ
jgi:hypothetical protein